MSVMVAARSSWLLPVLAVCVGCDADGQCLKEALGTEKFPPQLVTLIPRIEKGTVGRSELCELWEGPAPRDPEHGKLTASAPWTIMFRSGVMDCAAEKCTVKPIGGVTFELSDAAPRVDTANAALSSNRIRKLIASKDILYIAPNCAAAASAREVADELPPHEAIPATDPEPGCARYDSAPWGVSDACIPRLSASDEQSTGAPRKLVAIMDSGVDCRHPAIKQRIEPGDSTPDHGRRCRPDTGINYYHDHYYFADKQYRPAPPDNCNEYGRACTAHGTGVAGVIASEAREVPGVDPKAQLISMRVLAPSDGLPFVQPWTKVATAILESADRAQIINISAAWNINYPWLAAAVDQATRNGDRLIVAAASEETSGVPYPAAFTGCNDAVIGVANIKKTADPEYPYGWSPGADDTDAAYMVAAGQHVLTAYSTDLDPGYPFYMPQSGSSLAAPHVAGAASLVWSRKEFEHCSGAGVRALLECSARSTLIKARDPRRGTDERKRLHLGCLFTQRGSPICSKAQTCIQEKKDQYCRR